MKKEEDKSINKEFEKEKVQKAKTSEKSEDKKDIKIDKKDLKANFKDIQPGQIIKVYQKIKEKNTKGEEKERIQVFEGIVLARKHGQEVGATITVRKESGGIGVEKIFPINSPLIDKIEVVGKIKSRKSKLYYLKNYTKRLKKSVFK